MVQLEVSLTEQVAGRLERLSSRTGKPVTQLVQESVERLLDSDETASREERVKRALSVIGRFSSGLSDVARNHDEYIGQDLEDEFGLR